MFTNKDLRKLIIPLIIEQVLGVFVGIADTIMVSGVGEAAVSGVALVDSINVFFFTLFGALTTGGSVIAAQYIGKKSPKMACSAANQLLLAASLVALILMMFCLVGHRVILKFIFGGIEADVMSHANTYFVIMALSIPFLAAYNSCAALFRSMGNSRISMWTATVMNLINICGNALLIYVFHMGVAGAALASLISRMAAAGIMLYSLNNSGNIIHINRFQFRFQKDIIKKILQIGIPHSLESSIFQIGKLLVLSLVTSYGTAAIAANAVVNTVASFETLAGGAIGTSMVTVVGQCVGNGVYDEASFYVKKLMKLVYIIMGIINCLVFIITPILVAMFRLSPETADLTVKILRYHSLCCITIWPLSFTMPQVLRAASDVRYTMVVAIASMWTFRIGFSHLLGSYLGYGVFGVWIAMSIDWLCRGICFGLRFASGKWRGHVNI